MVELRRLVVQIGAVMGREVAVVLLDTGFQKRLMHQVPKPSYALVRVADD
jgi:hypothetical protein